MNSKRLCAKLEDWVASGLIAREQATAIAAYEEVNLIDWRFIKVIFQMISLSLQSMRP